MWLLTVFQLLLATSSHVAAEVSARNDEGMTQRRELHDIMPLSSLMAENENEGKGPPVGLSMAQFHELISTDIYLEFSEEKGKPSLSSEEMFHHATQLEWKRALNAEALIKNNDKRRHHPRKVPSEVHPHTSPFILCDYCANKTALTSKREIEDMTGTFHTEPVRNDDERSCFLVRMPPSLASEFALKSRLASFTTPEQNQELISEIEEEGEWCKGNFILQPVIPEMKIRSGTADSVLHAAEDDEDDNFVFFSEVVAVVGSDDAEDEDELLELGMSILESAKTKKTASALKHLGGEEQEVGVSLAVQRFLRLDRPLQKSDDDDNNDKHRALQQQLSFIQNERKSLWSQSLLEDSQSSTCQNIYSKFLQVIPSADDSKSISFSFFDGDVGTDKNATLSHLQEWIDDTSLIPSCLLSLVAIAATYTSVSSVDYIPAIKPSNREAQWIIQSNKDNYRPFFDVGLTGKDQVIAVSDTGLDMGNCYFNDESKVLGYDPKGAGPSHRKVVQYITFMDNTDDVDGHGTHVTGTVIGKGPGSQAYRANGIAKDAKVAFYDIGLTGSENLKIDTKTERFFGRGRNVGAKVHSASWGVTSAGGYTSYDRSYDSYMHKYDDFLVIAAAGNSGDKPRFDTMRTVVSPSTSKNGLSVGASESSGGDLEEWMHGKDYIATFSSRGSTADGRTKPDVIAPGYYIESAAAHNPNQCGTVHMAGTSMATPVVSGAAALIHQYFEEGYYPGGKPDKANSKTSSNALVKAILINGAQPLKGVDNKDYITKSVPYDLHQNFGLINLIESLPLEGKNTFKAHIEDRREIQDTEKVSMKVTIDKNGCTSSEFSATLVWNDPAGMVSCKKCIINNLDLFIQKNGDNKCIRPNGYTTQKDTINNAERIRIPVEDGDELMVTVDAHDLYTSKQKYSLVLTGCFRPEMFGHGLTVAPTISPMPTSIENRFPSPSPTESKSSNTGAIVGAVVGGVAGFVALVCLAVCLFRRKREYAEQTERTQSVAPAYTEQGEGPDYVALSQDEQLAPRSESVLT